MLADNQGITKQAVQIGWWVVALTTIALNIYALITMPGVISQVCTAPVCNDFQFTLKDLESMRAYGISLQTYTVLVVVQIALSVLVWNGIGVLLYRLKRGNPFILWVSIALITFGSSAFGPMNFVEQNGPPIISYAAQVINFIGQVGFLFFYVFPDGHFYPRWTRWLALAWVVLMAPLLIVKNYTPVTISPLIFIIFLAGAFFIPLWRYHTTADPIQRQQIKWVIYSMVLAIGYFLAFLAVGGLTRLFNSQNWFSMIANELLYLVMAFIPVSVGIAMLRYRLWDIDFIIRKTLLYAGLTALLAVLYLAAVILLQQVLRVVTGEQSAIAIVITTLATAALFNPLQRQFQVVIDRRFYRKKYDAQQTLDRFSMAARSEVDLHALSDHLLAVTDETLQPECMSLWLVGGSHSTPTK